MVLVGVGVVLFSSPGVGMGGEIRENRQDTLDMEGSEAGRETEIPRVDKAERYGVLSMELWSRARTGWKMRCPNGAKTGTTPIDIENEAKRLDSHKK